MYMYKRMTFVARANGEDLRSACALDTSLAYNDYVIDSVYLKR